MDVNIYECGALQAAQAVDVAGVSAGWKATEPPRVSALMVTAGRLTMASRAIDSFLRQTYPNRELVIVDDDLDDGLQQHVLGLGDDRIVYVRIPAENRPLGALRNLSKRHATGEFLCQWDDDDLSHPERLTTQMSAIMACGADACFMSREQIWWPESQRMAFSVRRLWEGSFVGRTALVGDYAEIRRGEDTPVTDRLFVAARSVVLDAPALYVYVVHGDNTFDEGHFEPHWTHATHQFDASQYAQAVSELHKLHPLLAVSEDTAPA